MKRFRTANDSSPIVTNNGASSITETTAHLSGVVNARGYDTVWTFPYGYSHGLVTEGRVTVDTIQSPISVPSGNATGYGDTPLAINLTDLYPNTQYYCQVIGVNSKGKRWSNIYGWKTVIPILTISGSLDFGTWLIGDTGTVSRTVTVTNDGVSSSTLNWNCDLAITGIPEGNIAIDVASGALLGGQSQVVTITLTKAGITSAGITPAEYTGLFTAHATWCDDETLNASVRVYPKYTGSIHMFANVIYPQSPYPPGTDVHIDGDVRYTTLKAYDPYYDVQYYPAVFVRFQRYIATGEWQVYWTNGNPVSTYPVTTTFRLSDGCPSATVTVTGVTPPPPVGYGTGTGPVIITPP
jgi:hypothetical protein